MWQPRQQGQLALQRGNVLILEASLPFALPRLKTKLVN